IFPAAARHIIEITSSANSGWERTVAIPKGSKRKYLTSTWVRRIINRLGHLTSVKKGKPAIA
ncbi:hypothetical protein, partial [Salinimicrobium oceani]|uniref:hypothetical protein n=1 Tax=Salinimicrobium oceani TaxID=2722702 RepID=UPI001ADDBF50